MRPEKNDQSKLECTKTQLLDRRISSALEILVRMLRIANGTITIQVRGGQLCRGLEVVNKVDVRNLD